MSEVKTYNPKFVTVALGTHMARGFGDDSIIEIEPVGDGVTSQSGCDGEIVRSVDPDSRYTVKLTLLQTSSTNAFLNNMRKRDKKYGTGTFPISIKDLMGNQKFTGSTAWVKNDATFKRGKEAENREWEIEVGDGNMDE